MTTLLSAKNSGLRQGAGAAPTSAHAQSSRSRCRIAMMRHGSVARPMPSPRWSSMKMIWTVAGSRHPDKARSEQEAPRDPDRGQRMNSQARAGRQSRLFSASTTSPQVPRWRRGTEPPRVCERLICSKLRRLFQGCSALHRIHPPFLAAADGQWRHVAALCCTS